MVGKIDEKIQNLRQILCQSVVVVVGCGGVVNVVEMKWTIKKLELQTKHTVYEQICSENIHK